jgi:hypothetical protein
MDETMTDDHARRELLWLRAKEEDDETSARDLERLDPELVERLRAAGADLAGRADESPSARRERFAQLWDDCYERHRRDLFRR